MLSLATRLANRLGPLHHLDSGGTEETARRPGRVLLVGPDAGGVLQDLARRVPEALLESADLEVLGLDQPMRLLQLVDEQHDVLRPELCFEEGLLDRLADQLEALRDALASHLRGLGPSALGNQLLPLAGQPLQPAHLLEESVRALVLLALGPFDRLGLRLVIAEDVPGLDFALAEPLRQIHHVLQGEIQREHPLPHFALAGFDLLGDRHLLLTGEEGDASHLLEVHAYGVGGLAGRPFGLLGLGLLLGPLRLGGLLGLFRERGILDRVDIDVHVAEHRDDLIELLGRRAFAVRVVWLTCFRVSRCNGEPPRPRPRVGRARLLLLNSLLWALHTEILGRSATRPEPIQRLGVALGYAPSSHVRGIARVRTLCPSPSAPPSGDRARTQFEGSLVAVCLSVKGNRRFRASTAPDRPPPFATSSSSLQVPGHEPPAGSGGGQSSAHVTSISGGRAGSD